MRLNPTPPDRLCDAQGRPTFLWDNNLTLDELRALLRSPDPDVAAYWLGTVMRQARPDDALTLAPPARMRELWPRLERYLGRERAFWAWYLSVVGEQWSRGSERCSGVSSPCWPASTRRGG